MKCIAKVEVVVDTDDFSDDELKQHGIKLEGDLIDEETLKHFACDMLRERCENVVKDGTVESEANVEIRSNDLDIEEFDTAIRNNAHEVIDFFEDLLNDKGVDIPSKDREDKEGVEKKEMARIYGEEYYALEDLVIGFLKDFRDKVKAGRI